MPAFSEAALEATLVEDSNTVIYDVPTGMAFRLTSIILTNYSLGGTPTTTNVTLMIGGTADVNIVRQAITLQPGRSYPFTDPLVLPADTQIIAIADDDGVVNAVVNGVVLHAP